MDSYLDIIPIEMLGEILEYINDPDDLRNLMMFQNVIRVSQSLDWWKNKVIKLLSILSIEYYTINNLDDYTRLIKSYNYIVSYLDKSYREQFGVPYKTA
ncbi:MAG TPA: hypothetical protein VKR58_05445, partial [Aquella sp.]|nr:hypothetical protein [Aquella sp.]